MEREYSIGVVIVNYKTRELTMACVESLRGQVDNETGHIVVVDNNSGPGEVVALEADLEKAGLSEIATVIGLAENKGFSAGNNAGIRSMRAGNYLLANSDTIFLPGAVASMLEALMKREGAGIVGPRLEWPDGKAQVSSFNFHRPPSEAIRSADTGLVTSLLRRFEVPVQPSDAPSSPDWISFACALIRREVFERIGFLDDGYFMYYEDSDFCRRARNAGFGILHWPYARVIHLQGRSSEVAEFTLANKRLPDFYYHSRARYYRKHHGKLGFILANACWLAGRSISLARQAAGRKARPVPEGEWKGIWKSRPGDSL
jgi:N-acetylglucosaminyl-diphospho-decaprenol L-rhamnosyltransferase